MVLTMAGFLGATLAEPSSRMCRYAALRLTAVTSRGS